MLTGLRYHCAVDPVGVGESAQCVRRGGGILGDDVVRRRLGQLGAGDRCGEASRGRGYREPPRDVSEASVFSDQCRGIPLGVSRRVAAEEAVDGLRFGACVGGDVAVDIHESAEQVRVLHRQVQSARSSGGPAHDAPIGGIVAHPEVVNHVRHDILREVVSRIAARAVDAFGVVVECADGIGEYGHRSVATVFGGKVIERCDCVPGTNPVGGGIELTADHHDGRKHGRRVACEVGRWQVDELGAVGELGLRGRDVHRHQLALGRHRPGGDHLGDGGVVGLAGQGASGQLAPCCRKGGEVAHPQIQHERRAQHGQGHRQQRCPTAPPVG